MDISGHQAEPGIDILGKGTQEIVDNTGSAHARLPETVGWGNASRQRAGLRRQSAKVSQSEQADEMTIQAAKAKARASTRRISETSGRYRAGIRRRNSESC